MLFKFKENRVVILGLNNISIYLARTLSMDRDVVILYRKKSEKFCNINIDVLILEIENNLAGQLKEYLSEDQTIFISLTEDDEYNIFSAQLAQKIGTKLCLAGVSNNDYLKVNLDCIFVFNPLQLIVDKINLLLNDNRFKNIINYIPGKIKITQIEVRNSDYFSYCRIEDIKFKESIIIAINRKDKTFIPESSLKLLPGDIIYILYKRYFPDFLKILKNSPLKKRRLFIIGSEITGKYFINYWKDIFASTIIIEPDLNKCNNLAVTFERPHILNAEVTDLQLLREEGIDRRSIYIACSDDDGNNLLGSYAAVSQGCSNVLTILNREANREIAQFLKLNKILLKSEIISNYIVSILKSDLKNINKYILGKEIFIMEIIIKKDFRIKNMEIKKLNLPPGVIIGAIIRNGRAIIPDGETNLKYRDKLIIFFQRKLEKRIGGFFS